MSSFKEKTDTRLASLHLELSPQDIYKALHKQRPVRRSRLYAVITAICVLLTLSGSVFAVQTLQKAEKTRQDTALDFFLQRIETSVRLSEEFESADEDSFYLRYLSETDMAVIDRAAEEYGAALYFEGLKNDNIYVQYFCINKLVEFYNDSTQRVKALEALGPFLSHENNRLSEAAEFACAILSGSFEHPWIHRLSDDSVFFCLFNEYSDYGSYPSLYRIKDDNLVEFDTFSTPIQYIKKIKLSENREKVAMLTGSNKSEQLFIIDFANGLFSPELVTSTLAKQAAEKGYTFLARTDFENYSSVITFEWRDDNTIFSEMQLVFSTADTADTVSIAYHFEEKSLELFETERIP